MRRLEASTSSTLDLDLLAESRQILAGVDVLLGPRHFGNVDEALDARLELDERAVVGDIGDADPSKLADHRRCSRVSMFVPRRSSCNCFMPSEMRWVSWLILMMRTLTCWRSGQDFARMVDAPPGDVGHVQEAVDAAEIDERAVIGEVLDRAVDDLPLGEVGDDLVALLGAALLEHGAAGRATIDCRAAGPS